MAKHQLFCTAALNRAKEVDSDGEIFVNMPSFVTKTALQVALLQTPIHFQDLLDVYFNDHVDFDLCLTRQVMAFQCKHAMSQLPQASSHVSMITGLLHRAYQFVTIDVSTRDASCCPSVRLSVCLTVWQIRSLGQQQGPLQMMQTLKIYVSFDKVSVQCTLTGYGARDNALQAEVIQSSVQLTCRLMGSPIKTQAGCLDDDSMC